MVANIGCSGNSSRTVWKDQLKKLFRKKHSIEKGHQLNKKCSLEREIIENANSRGRLLDKRHLLESGCLLDHLW